MNKNQQLILGGVVVLALVLLAAFGSDLLYLGSGWKHVDYLATGNVCQIQGSGTFYFRQYNYQAGTSSGAVSWYVTNSWTSSPFPFDSGYAEFQDFMTVSCNGGTPTTTCTPEFQRPVTNNQLPCCGGTVLNVDGFCMKPSQPTPTPIVVTPTPTPTPSATPVPTPYCANQCLLGQSQAAYPSCLCSGGATPSPTTWPTPTPIPPIITPKPCGNSLGVLCDTGDTAIVIGVLVLVTLGVGAVFLMRR